MPDITTETAKKFESGEGALKGATTNEAAREALTGLASTDSATRAVEVTQATNLLVLNGDLPKVLLVFDGLEEGDALYELGMGDDVIDWNNEGEREALELAAQTGQFTDAEGNVVQLSNEEWIAAQALYQNFSAIEGTASEGNAGDGKVSITDLGISANDPEAQATLGTEYAELQTAVAAFPGNPDGSQYPESFKAIFGKEDVTKDEIESLITGPEWDNLTPAQQRGVMALHSQYDSIAGLDGNANSVNQTDLWMAAGYAGINAGGDANDIGVNATDLAAGQADVDAYESARTPVPPLTGEAVDAIIRDIAKPTPSGMTSFEYLDKLDGTVDGNVSREQVHALAEDPALGFYDPQLQASLQNLDANWNQLAGEDGVLTIEELAAQSAAYVGDTTPEAIKAHATRAAEPPTAEEADNAMRAVFAPNPGSDSSAFYTLTQGQEGRPEDRAGFAREDIDRTLDTYKAIYGENSPEYQDAQASLGKVREDFDKYDANHDGRISWGEMGAVSGDGRTVGQLQEAFGEADPAKLAAVLESGSYEEKLGTQKNITQEELSNYYDKLPEGDPRREFLQYLMEHYDEIRMTDGEEELTWTDIEQFSGTADGGSGSSSDGGSNDSAGSSGEHAEGDSVPMATGQGTVNADGSVTYTTGQWTEEIDETSVTLAETALAYWGVEPPYSQDNYDLAFAVLNTSNPGLNLNSAYYGYMPGGTTILIPAEPEV